MLKLILRLLACVLGLVLVLAVGLVAYLTVTEYMPADREAVSRYALEDAAPVQTGQPLTVYSWNIGYAGLGANSDFFMDGGKMVDPPSQEAVEQNMAAILEFIGSREAAAWLLQEEYEKGNYVIAGGDFNQSFPGALEAYPIADPEKWTPGILEDDTLPEGWQFAYDTASPTCRLLDQPYNEDRQLYVIDGFILSPNVQLNAVETVGLNFQNADHNPVRLEATLAP